MADVEQMRKIIPFATCEITFGQIVCELMFGINVSNLNCVSKISTATLWVLDTCLIVGLRPFIIILITASLSSKTYIIALEPECVPFDGTWSMLVRSRLLFVFFDRDVGHLCFGRRIQISGHSDFGVFNDDGASSILTWVSANTASAACPAQPGSLAMTSVICDADGPCSINTACDPESSFTVSPRSTTLPLYFWYWGSSSEFLRWQRSTNDAKKTFIPLFLASSVTSFLFLTLVSCHTGIFSSFSHYLSTAAFAFGIFTAGGIGINLCTKLWWLSEFIPFAAMWSSWDLCGTPSNRILIDSSASTIQAYLVVCFPILLQVSPRHVASVLQSIAAGIGISNFLRAALIVSLNSSSFGSMKKIPRNLLALSSFGFSIAHLCFAILFAASDMCFHISGHTSSGREVFCFLVSLHPGPCISFRWPFL